jgi:hypothetical protein
MGNIPLKDINLHAKRFVCRFLFLGLVWRASNSISFLTLHLCPFLNANSYNADPEEISRKTEYKNAKYSIWAA